MFGLYQRVRKSACGAGYFAPGNYCNFGLIFWDLVWVQRQAEQAICTGLGGFFPVTPENALEFPAIFGIFNACASGMPSTST